jgi:hypothetical protein
MKTHEKINPKKKTHEKNELAGPAEEPAQDRV